MKKAAELNLTQSLMKSMQNFRFQDKVVEAEEPLRRLLPLLCQLLLSIPGRTILFNGPEGILEGEQETLYQLQESNNQTSCIKIFACFPIPNMIRYHEELLRQIWSSVVSTWTHSSWTSPGVRLAFMWSWRPCSKKP